MVAKAIDLIYWRAYQNISAFAKASTQSTLTWMYSSGFSSETRGLALAGEELTAAIPSLSGVVPELGSPRGGL